MKRRGFGLFVVVSLVVLFVVACAGPSKQVKSPAVSVMVATPMVEIGKTAQVVFYGTGFAPKQEVVFLFKDASQVLTRIANEDLKPQPVPNEVGAWVTVWNCGPYLSLIKPGTSMIRITDTDYQTLAQVPVAFFAVEKKEKK